MTYIKHTWQTGEIITADKLNNIESGIEAVDSTAYTKPAGGIPKSDLASTVRASLGKADESIAAPASPSNGQVLKYNGSSWVAVDLDADDVGAIESPASPSNGQILKFNGTAWVAVDIGTYFISHNEINEVLEG